MAKILIYGNTIISKMLYFDALGDKEFEIEAFLVDKEYLAGDSFMGLPQIDIEKALRVYDPNKFQMLSVLGGYSRVRSREEFYNKANIQGFKLANYLSKKSEVSPDIQLGANNIIFSGSYIGPNGKLGDNNIVRQNVYLGHDFTIGDHNVISPGCNFAGLCKIQNLCYIGIGSTIIENITIFDETLIGAGSVVLRNTEPFSKNVGNPSKLIGYHVNEGIEMKVRNE